MIPHNKTHGKTLTPEYQIWAAMIGRCETPSTTGYLNYGARGIKVCARWRHSFVAFIQDVGVRPSVAHSLDRIDNDGNYEPSNVRWSTRLEQANNKRTSRIVEYRGAQMTVADAARAGGAGVRRETAICRIRNGWSINAAVETPPLFKRAPDGTKIRTHAE